jgi:hypothetical protein
MPSRGQTQDQQKGRRNPGIETPEDDDGSVEARETGVTQSQSQQRRQSAEPDPLTTIEEEEAEDDEDDADGVGARP